MATILRAGLLAQTRVICASPAPSEHLSAARELCLELGATVDALAVDPLGDEPDPGGRCDVLLWDGAGAFAAAGATIDGARAALDGAWLAARPIANAHMIPEARGGKIVLLAPPPGGPFAAAARAGLENLARVTSIEWARFQIKIVAIHPSPATPAGDVAELVAYVASPAGDYASGCVFALR